MSALSLMLVDASRVGKTRLNPRALRHFPLVTQQDEVQATSLGIRRYMNAGGSIFEPCRNQPCAIGACVRGMDRRCPRVWRGPAGYFSTARRRARCRSGRGHCIFRRCQVCTIAAGSGTVWGRVQGMRTHWIEPSGTPKGIRSPSLSRSNIETIVFELSFEVEGDVMGLDGVLRIFESIAWGHLHAHDRSVVLTS